MASIHRITNQMRKLSTANQAMVMRFINEVLGIQEVEGLLYGITYEVKYDSERDS